MAIAVQTTTNTTWATGSTTLTLTKPTNTADGDLLIAVIGNVGDGTSAGTTNSVPSGWNLVLTTTTGNDQVLETYYKIASSEGASWNWGFTLTTSYKMGGVLRIDGQGVGNPITVSDFGTDANDETPEFTGGITPTAASSLLVMPVLSSDNGESTTASYAITTSNPTWTEAFDVVLSGVSLNTTLALAYAIRPEVTATGDWTCTLSTGTTQESASHLLGIIPRVNTTQTPAVVTAIIAVQTPTVTGSANVSPSVVTSVLSVQAPTVSLTANPISNMDKSSTTWVNQDKS